MTIIHEERNYQELKESIRMMNSQRSDTEKINLIEEGKKIGIDEVIKSSYCLKCRENNRKHKSKSLKNY